MAIENNEFYWFFIIFFSLQIVVTQIQTIAIWLREKYFAYIGISYSTLRQRIFLEKRYHIVYVVSKKKKEIK